MADKKDNIEQVKEEKPAPVLALAADSEPAAPTPTFFVLVDPPKQTASASPAPAGDKPRAEPVNNILLGEISKDLFDSIAPGKVVQAKFYQQEIKIKYHVQPGDSPVDALTKLREAIFCAHYSKPLPAHCEIHSVYGSNAIAARLGAAIAETGEIDATVECYE